MPAAHTGPVAPLLWEILGTLVAHSLAGADLDRLQAVQDARLVARRVDPGNALPSPPPPPPLLPPPPADLHDQEPAEPADAVDVAADAGPDAGPADPDAMGVSQV